MNYSINTFFSANGEIKADEREALRYLGYGRNVPDEKTQALIAECKAELERIISAKCCYIKVPVILEESTLNIGFGEIQSKALINNLKGCTQAFIFAATIGIGADRLIVKYERTSPSKAVVIDALASSAIEAWCDKINNQLCENLKSRPRFSPGYGDFDIKHQKDIIALLDTSRKIGLSLTDSMLMTPTKSVTAIIGIC
jgi:hypothetical protein